MRLLGDSNLFAIPIKYQRIRSQITGLPRNLILASGGQV